MNSNSWLWPGDILACSGASFQSDFINVVTYGLPRFSVSHVMTCGEYNGKLLLFESTQGCSDPCIIRREHFEGTQAHEVDSRIKGYHGKVWHYRLKQPLRAFERKRYSRFLIDNLGRPYDSPGAFRSGGAAWSWLEAKFHPSCLSALFCSEYVVAALNKIERWDTDHLSKWSPNAFIREGNRRGIFSNPVRLK